MAIIKFALSRNLIYPLQHIIWNLIRHLLTMFIKHLFKFSDSLIYSPLMFLGELLGGAIIYFYQKRYIKVKKLKKRTNILCQLNYL